RGDRRLPSHDVRAAGGAAAPRLDLRRRCRGGARRGGRPDPRRRRLDARDAARAPRRRRGAGARGRPARIQERRTGAVGSRGVPARVDETATGDGTMNETPYADFGRVRVFFGEKNGKYPDGNQVVVQGSDTRAAFDTPLVANRIGEPLESADIVVLGHVHEDHVAGLHRLPHAKVFAHERDVAAARSWPGLAASYGLSPSVVDAMLAKIRREFHYVPRPDAIAYRDGEVWELGGVRIRAVHMPGHTAGHCVLVVEPE